MSITSYQEKYFAHELTRRFPPDSVEKRIAALRKKTELALLFKIRWSIR